MVTNEGIHYGGVHGLVGETVDLVGVCAQLVFFRETHSTLKVRTCPVRQQQLRDMHVTELAGEMQGQATDACIDFTPFLDEQLDDCHVVADDCTLQQREAIPVDHTEHIAHLLKI